MIPGMNPRQMRQAMKKMGIAQEDIDATEVVIRCPDRDIVITNPSVAKIKAMGSEQFTISGEVHERERTADVEIKKEDIQAALRYARASLDHTEVKAVGA